MATGSPFVMVVVAASVMGMIIAIIVNTVRGRKT